jgi:hypothetical protein
VTNRIVSEIEWENGFATVDRSVLKIIMKIRRKESPFMLLAHLRSDFAAPIRGTRKDRRNSNGMMLRKRKDTMASTIERNILERGSRSWTIDDFLVYWNTSRNDRLSHLQ